MNKVAIVTGAAKGIGRAIALRLAKDGMNIAINYRSNDVEAKELVEEINKLGVSAIAIKADISDFTQAETLIKDTLKVFNRIDVIVNNAGITKDCLLLRMTEEDFDSVIDINLKGTFNCIKHVTPVMLKQKAGKIINISSVVGITGNVGQVNYSASKAGVIAMTKSIAKEIGSRGICVNAVAPGFIQTDMTAKLSSKAVEELSKSIALKRLGLPEDVAKAVSFLASEDSDYITGQVLCVDGGMVM